MQNAGKGCMFLYKLANTSQHLLEPVENYATNDNDDQNEEEEKQAHS